MRTFHLPTENSININIKPQKLFLLLRICQVRKSFDVFRAQAGNQKVLLMLLIC